MSPTGRAETAAGARMLFCASGTLGVGHPPDDLQRPMKNKDRYWDCLDQAMEASHGGRTDEALAWLEEALRAHPDGAEAHNGRGEILWDEGKIDEALHEFERALRAHSKFVTAHLNRAELLIEDLSEFEQAVTLCDELLAGRAELPRLDRATEGEVHYLKAKAVFYLDDLEGALFLVRRALKTAGEVGIYRSFEGQILFELGRLEAAYHRVSRHSVAGLARMTTLRFLLKRFLAQRLLGVAIVVTLGFTIGVLVAGPIYADAARQVSRTPGSRGVRSTASCRTPRGRRRPAPGERTGARSPASSARAARARAEGHTMPTAPAPLRPRDRRSWREGTHGTRRRLRTDGRAARSRPTRP